MDEIDLLVRKLEKMFPDKMVTKEMNEFDRAKLAGKVELIRELKKIYDSILVEEEDIFYDQ